ncbi:MAG: DUF5110 domain-containing protein, partial [Candidatus Kapaibacteriota bacterium]
GGSIIPMQSVIQHTGQKSSDTLFVHVYAANSGVSTQEFYYDDGLTYSYEQGNSASMNMIYDAQNTSFTFDDVKGSYTPHFKTIAIIFHGFSDISSAKVNGKSSSVSKRSVSFMKALSNFDPLGSQATEGAIPVQVIHIPYPTSRSSINW